MGDTTYNAPYNPAPYSPYAATSSQNRVNINVPQLGKTSGPKVLPQPLLGESYDPHPTERLQWDNTGIVLTPGRTVAPVGSQVIIIGGVVGPDNYLSMNERVEWSLTSGSVGQFVEVDSGSSTNYFLLDFTFPRKISPFEAVTSTSRNNLNLNRGTPTKTDDIKVRRGETWIAVSSPVEGTSFVNALAPSVYGWHARERTATIHWIDAEWQFPAPSFGPAGGHQTLTTKVSRHSDHRPLVGWRVRYTVTCGPAAGFNGSKVIEVVTNQNGEAVAVLGEEQAVAGTNQLDIEIVRPDGACGVEDAAIKVGTGSTMVTWSAPELSLTKTGPMAVGQGTTVTYQLNVTNPGDLPTDDVQITDEIPFGAEYVDSTPPAQQTGNSLRWSIGRLGPRESRAVQVRVRMMNPGNIMSSAEATAVGGLTARSSVTTQVGSPKLDVIVQSRYATVRVGDTAWFNVDIYNRSQVSATNLTILDRFDEGLVFEDDPKAMSNREIKGPLSDILPGQSTRVTIKFKTTRSGRFGHEVIVTDGSGNQTSARGHVDVSPASPTVSEDVGTSTEVPGTPGTSGTEPSLLGGYPPANAVENPSATVGRPEIRIQKTGPAQIEIGKTAVFSIAVQNVGTTALTNLEVVDSYDPQLKPTWLTDGYRKSTDGQAVSWVIPSLPSGKAASLQIECEAVGLGRARNQASVTTDQDVHDTSEVSIDIVQPAAAGGAVTPGAGGTGISSSPPSGVLPQRGNLVMNIYDYNEPVVSNKQFNYTIEIKNHGSLPDQNVTLTVDVSPELIPFDTGTDGPTPERIVGQRIQFEPVSEILPNQTLRYQIRVKASKPGVFNAKATVSSRGVVNLEVSEQTRVIAP